TLEEAETLAKVVQARKWHSAIVVTSNYHTRRARYIFRHVFPRGIDVRVASARDGDFDPEAWWEKRKSSKLFMREILGMMVAFSWASAEVGRLWEEPTEAISGQQTERP